MTNFHILISIHAPPALAPPSKPHTCLQNKTHRRSTRLLQNNSRTLSINTLLKQPRIIRSTSTNKSTSWLFRFWQITHGSSKDGTVFGGGVIGPFFEFGSSGSFGSAAEEPWFDDVVEGCGWAADVCGDVVLFVAYFCEYIFDRHELYFEHTFIEQLITK